MQRYALLILKFRIPLLVLLLAMLAGSIWALPRVQLDFSVFSLLESTDEAKREIDQFYEYLPPRKLDAVALIEWPDPITHERLREIASLAKELEELPEIRSVGSLAKAFIVESRLGLPIPRTFLTLPESTDILATVEEHPLLRGRLLSRDGRCAALTLVRETEADASESTRWLDEARRVVGENLPEGVKARFIATQLVERAMARHMRHDMLQSILLEVICFIILMPILFRSLHAMLIPLVVVGYAVLLNFGLMYVTGMSLSLIEVAIPGLITIIALCDTIHMIHRFEEKLASGTDERHAILDMMSKVGMACLYTSLTTALGFLSLLIVDHRTIRDFAVSASIGVVVAFATVITLLPLLLSLLPSRSHTRGGMRRFLRLSYGKRKLTFAIAGVLLLVSGMGIARMDIGSKWLEEFPPGEPIVKDLTWYQDHFSGFLNLDVKLQGNLDSVDAFFALEALQTRILEEEGVTSAESFTHWVREMMGNPTGEVSRTRVMAGLAYVKLSGAAFPEHVVTRDFRLGRIRFQTKDVGTNRFLELNKLIEKETVKLPGELQAEVAGFSRMAHESSFVVITTMMRSLMVSMITISLFIMVIYRSVKLGFLAAIPNGLPIIAALGLTGWLGIHLRIGIVMIYSLGVGLAVDNTIHLITRFIQERRENRGRSIGEHLHSSLRTTGNALVASSAVLVIGSLCYLPSSFRSMSEVGILLSTMVVVALLTEVFVFPHLLEYFGAPGPKQDDIVAATSILDSTETRLPGR